MDGLLKLYNMMDAASLRETTISVPTQLLITIKNELNNRYYNTGEDVVDDTKYDLIVEELARRGEKLEVGCKLRDGENAAVLPYYLGGMDKLKCGEDKKIAEWFAKNKFGSYLISDKLNGVSCLAWFGETGAVKLYTRGDCNVGADISYLAKNIKGLVNCRGISVRGELILTDADYMANPHRKKNCLSTIIGLINSKTLQEGVNKLRFVAFELIDRTESPYDNMKALCQLGFEVANNTLVNSKALLSSQLKELVIQRKAKSIYDIDGLVIQADRPYNRKHIGASGNPSYAIAFKVNLEIADVEVVDVVWEISRYGVIKPQVKIVPTQICNITNVSLSGFNAKFIKDNVIGRGSIITITRSGDIIPYIMGVVKPADNNTPLFPDYEYQWNDTEVDILIKGENGDRDVNQITHFFKTLSVKHISSGIIRKLYFKGYTTIREILEMDVKTMTGIDGIGAGVAGRISEVHNALKSVRLSDLLVASGIFEGFGNKRIELICDVFNPLTDDIKVSSLSEINGISTLLASRFIQRIPIFIDFYTSIQDFIVLEAYKSNAGGASDLEVKAKYQGFVFTFTGFRDKRLEDTIRDMGGDVSDTITKATTHLVVKVKDGTSAKMEKARKSGISIVDAQFFK